MRAFGYVRSVPSGSSMTFNRTLRAAIIRFQKKHHLKADGVVAKKTWDAIVTARHAHLPFTYDSYIAPTAAAAKGASSAARIRAMKAYFEHFHGRSPYTWGGMGAKEASAGFDCSGLVYQMVAAGGIVISSTDPKRHAEKSFRSTQAIYADKKLRRYPLSQRRNGDIITFANSTRRRLTDVRHDGIFYNGRLLESNSGGVISTKWNGGTLHHRGGAPRYPMPYVQRPFA